jgi:predicted patatin/cPLA2 family phospholipase
MSNKGVISGTQALIDTTRYARYLEGRTALIAQGGGQRGIFTSGVLDAFMRSNFDPFDMFYGTSAGAMNLCAFLCRQPGLGKAFILDLTMDDQFFNLFGFIRRKQKLNMEWALDRICDYPYKLDLDLGRQALRDREAFAAVTDAAQLHDSYLPMMGDDWFDVMRATCAIPGLYGDPVQVAGRSYMDGGVSAAIPVQQAWRQEARNIIVIRTESLPQEKDDETRQPVTWLREPVSGMHEQWQQKLDDWKKDWSDFWQEQLNRSRDKKPHHRHLNLINGGRWLFGADDVYRLSHLFGDKFDSGMADLLMVHYQTYTLTQAFLSDPPDDCFVVQITPAEPLRSSSLLSRREDLLFDYQMGLDAGYQYIKSYIESRNQIWVDKIAMLS